MLEHEPEPQPPTVNLPPGVNSSPAANPSPANALRVTPQELTAALASLDAERQSDARRLEDTITIGEAVQELHLEASPEDIWRHVQAQRAHRAPVTPAAPLSATPWKTMILAGVVFGSALLGGLNTLRHTERAAVSRATVSASRPVRLALPSHADITVSGDNTTATYRCNGSNVSITGNNSRIRLQGHCADVVVTGDNDTVVLDAAPSVTVSGSNDTVHWRSSSQPAITNIGSNNTLSPQ